MKIKPMYLVIALLSLNVTASDSESETPTLDKLKKEHDLENTERNFRQLDSLQLAPADVKGDGRTEALLDSFFESGLQDGEQLDFSQYHQDLNQQELMNNANEWALGSSSTVGMPTMNDQGGFKVEYSEQGTLRHARNESGEFGFAASDGGARRTSGLAQEDMFSQEINSEDHKRFDGIKSSYGNEDSLYSHGSQNIGQLRNQQNLTSDAVAYRTILDSQERALETEINEGFLDGTVEFLDDFQNDPSEFFSACRTVSSTSTVGAEGNLKPEQTCTEIDRNNYDFCELRRDYRMPVFIEGESVGICGPDCFFVEIGDADSQKKFKAETDCDLFQESRRITLNLDSSISIRSVEVEGGVDDHGKVLINNRSVASMVWGESGIDLPLPPTGAGAPRCETGQWNPFSRNITSQTLNIINSASQDTEGRVNLDIAMNSAIRHEGGYHARVKFYFDDHSGDGFGEIVTSYPEGCYDRTSKGSGGGGQSCKVESVCAAHKTWTNGMGGLECSGPLSYEDYSDYATACGYVATDYVNCGSYRTSPETITVCDEQPGEGGGPEGEAACSYNGYEIIEEGSRGFPESILDSIGPLFPGDDGYVTWRANLEGYACEPFDGEEICITPYKEDGEVCKSWYGWFGRHDDDLSELPSDHPALKDACGEYRNNPRCERIESKCAEGMRDRGNCRVYDVRYECAVGIGGSREIVTETNQCDAMIPCAGGECDNTNNEVNEDFNAAALQASVLHELNNDNSCLEGEGGEGCEVFTGTYSQCSKGTGVVDAVSLAGADCCDDPTAVGVQEYVRAMYMVSQFEVVQNSTTWATTPIKGGYDKIKTAGVKAWDKVATSFTSAGESAAANAPGTVAGQGAGEGIFTAGLEAVKEATRRWMGENLPQGVAHAIFATTTEEVAGEMVTKIADDPPQWGQGMQQLGNFAQGLMTAYGYYTMAKLAMDLIFQCDAEESEAAGSIAQLQCVYLGEGSCRLNLLVGCARRDYEYCCFNSLLARVIMEQAVEQLDRPLTQDDQGSCRGLTLEELSQLDWDLIDLESEWLPLMYESGIIFESTSEEMLTGDGRMINQGARDLVSERTKDRFRGITDDDVKDIDRELRDTLDCSQYPRPPVCNYQ